MNLLHQVDELGRLSGPLHLAIGVFDGLHLGHAEVIEAACVSAREQGGTAVVVTFDPHPVQVLAPSNAPRLLTSTRHQVEMLGRNHEISNVLVINFDDVFSAQTGEEFVRSLLESAPESGIGRICVGEDWQFGKARSGNIDLLRRMGEEFGFAVTGVPTVEVLGGRVSSTRVREAVGAGDFEIAKALLGRDYTVLGTVIKGRQLGRTIGFPTANLTVHSEQLPPTGVYAVSVVGQGDSWNGVANLGYRPTVEGGDVKRLLEVHLFDMSSDIYGEELEVTFVKFLRGEKKFDGIEALKAQIALDVEAARSVFS
ncbi:MAG: bifunctional riboflavin kinase/FAD synthetase [Verrucomicrobiales bacterium]|nr:bifunctional riboflavin kinase/FAD synthetase [Verrucomicrobiales bacterium]